MMTTFPSPLTRADLLVLEYVRDWETRFRVPAAVSIMREALQLADLKRVEDMIAKDWLRDIRSRENGKLLAVGLQPLGRVQIQLGRLGVLS